MSRRQALAAGKARSLGRNSVPAFTFSTQRVGPQFCFILRLFTHTKKDGFCQSQAYLTFPKEKNAHPSMLVSGPRPLPAAPGSQNHPAERPGWGAQGSGPSPCMEQGWVRPLHPAKGIGPPLESGALLPETVCGKITKDAYKFPKCCKVDICASVIITISCTKSGSYQSCSLL